MHYYQYNIGNYRRRTGHLTILEHGAYRSLMDTYYLEEQPLCVDIAHLMRTHSARTEDEQKAIKSVLSDFFILTEDGYCHADMDEKIAEYHGKSDKARKSAQIRWGKDANAMRTHTEGNANHKPLTNNQEPVTKKRETSVPDKFEVTPEMFSWATEQGLPEMRIKPETENFLDRCRAKDIKYLNWVAAWRTWVRNAVKFTKA
jgi:uncharacterized protein YdaU (DUF1376 family)